MDPVTDITLGGVVVGVMLLLLILAGFYLARLQAKAFQSTGIPGVTNLGGIFEGWINDAINFFEGLWDGLIGAAAHALWLVISPATRFVDKIFNGIVHATWLAVNAGNFARTLYYDAVGFARALYDSAIGYAEGLFHAAIAYATTVLNIAVGYSTSLFDGAINYATQLYHDALNYATTLYNTVVGYATQLYNTAINYATGVFHAAIDYAGGLFTTAEHDIVQAFTQAENYTYAQVSGLAATVPITAGAVTDNIIGAIDQAAHDLVIGPWQELLPHIETLVQDVPAELVQSIPNIGAVTRDLPLTVPAILGALAPALALVGSEVADCVPNLCTGVGDLSKLFNDLNQGIWLIALVALLTESLVNPRGTADALEGFGREVSGLAQGLIDLVGGRL